ncbi:MAG TPA: hypothetical protein VMV44_15385 [Rectinemataceae bacterium]|nr:hypothetical protein [Rectinemataceae bacterium]
MRRLLAGLLYLFLGLPVAFSGLLALSVKPWALDPSFYRRAIEDQRLWTALRSPEALKGVPERMEIGGYIFSGPALYGALQKHIPEAELKSLGGLAVDDIIGALRAGRSATALDLRPLKSSLSKNSRAFAADYLRSLPRGLPTSSTDLRVLPEGSAGKASSSAAQATENLIASIPDMVTPDVQTEPRASSRGGLTVGRGGLDRMSSSALAAGAVLLLGLGFLGGGGIGRSLSRAGRFLIIPSAIVLAAGIALSIPGAPLALELVNRLPKAPEASFVAALGGWLGSWLGVAARSFFVVGLSGVSIGALLVSLRRIFEPREF